MGAAAVMSVNTLHALYQDLMAARRGEGVEESLARILASWVHGAGAMPDWLGLGETVFQRMLAYHFPAYDAAAFNKSGRDLAPERGDEMLDLRKLLLAERSDGTESQEWMADIVIAGCLGSDHLWQDLGLWNRADLSKLMLDNFKPLALRNNKDMKWKKFLYKQLCEAEGIYTCRAPSCEVCADYKNCFGPEE